MKNGISIFYAEDVIKVRDWPRKGSENRSWRIARPIGRKGFKYKLLALMLVFTEQADLLVWDKKISKK